MIKFQTLKGFRDFLPVKISKKTKAGIFIDDANVFDVQKQLCWKLDWEKLFYFIKADIDLKIVRYYLGMPTFGESKIKNFKLQKRLESFGYTVITKPLKRIYINKTKGEFKYKCNFDVEIALDIATFVKDLDLVIIVSGDSDFTAIRDFTLVNNKIPLFMCFERNMAWEIRVSKFLTFDKIKKLIKH